MGQDPSVRRFANVVCGVDVRLEPTQTLPDVETVVLGWWRDQGPLTVFWDGLHWGDAGDDIAIGYAITHWMPLPGKPQ